MLASLTALGAIVVSDFAQAAPSRDEWSDELDRPEPVTMKKQLVAQEPEVDALQLLEPMKNARRGKGSKFYGNFEGY